MIKLNNIYKEDCISFMQKMAEENLFADVTSPPYNLISQKGKGQKKK
jgi:DNA modification methylase